LIEDEIVQEVHIQDKTQFKKMSHSKKDQVQENTTLKKRSSSKKRPSSRRPSSSTIRPSSKFYQKAQEERKGYKLSNRYKS